MQAWASFYTVTASAAATLLGLLFVALSISGGSDFTRARSTSGVLAEQAFQNYLAVLVISCLLLFPDSDPATTAGACLFVIGTKTVWAITRTVQNIRQGGTEMPRLASLRRHAVTIVGLGLVFYATVRLAAGHRDTFHTLAAGVLVLLGSSATVSWELLHHLLGRRVRGEP
jgi:hypothetical protein